MNFLLQHIDKIVDAYDLSEPLSLYLKKHFKSNPKLGSRDRKAISHGIFLYYRFAKRLPSALTPFEIIYNGLTYSGTDNSFLRSRLLDFDPALPSKTAALLSFDTANIPPISDGIQPTEWDASFLVQPDLFIRIRNKKAVAKLDEAGISYQVVEGSNCLSLPNSASLEKVLSPDSYVVQDWASQESVRFLLSHLDAKEEKSLWDCCAGAGGKSLMIRDLNSNTRITATDIRDTILHNLASRFSLYNLPLPEIMTLNTADPKAVRRKLGNREFDVILCDVPCSGSGTWARTPEQYHFFNGESLKKRSETQFQITSNALPYLRKNGLIAYVTCSVFRQENEEVVDKICSRHEMAILEQRLINGIGRKADSLFIAILKKK